jgi:hypothetical protein
MAIVIWANRRKRDPLAAKVARPSNFWGSPAMASRRSVKTPAPEPVRASRELLKTNGLVFLHSDHWRFAKASRRAVERRCGLPEAEINTTMTSAVKRSMPLRLMR